MHSMCEIHRVLKETQKEQHTMAAAGLHGLHAAVNKDVYPWQLLDWSLAMYVHPFTKARSVPSHPPTAGAIILPQRTR